MVAALAVSAIVTGPVVAQASPPAFALAPIDPQHWRNQYDMTWDD